MKYIQENIRGIAFIILIILYHVGAIATFGKLTFFDDNHYTWWNWIIIVPLNMFLSEIWPIYWIIKDFFSVAFIMVGLSAVGIYINWFINRYGNENALQFQWPILFLTFLVLGALISIFVVGAINLYTLGIALEVASYVLIIFFLNLRPNKIIFIFTYALMILDLVGSILSLFDIENSRVAFFLAINIFIRMMVMVTLYFATRQTFNKQKDITP